MKNDSQETSKAFSFVSTRGIFESLGKPENRNNVANLLKNPVLQKHLISASQNKTVQSAALSAAENPKVRSFVMENSEAQIAERLREKPIMAIAPITVNQFEQNLASHSTSASPKFPSKSVYPSLTNDTSYNADNKYNHDSVQVKNDILNIFKKETSIKPVVNNTPSPIRPPPPQISPRNVGHSSNEKMNLLTEPYANVQYSYVPRQNDELQCDVNDIVLLKNKVDDYWMYATNIRTGKSGIVPTSFLSIQIPLISSQPLPFNVVQQTDTSNFSFSNFNFTNNNSTSSKSFIARGIYDFDTGVDGDLNFQAGDIINVLERVNDEWLRGSANGHVGIFPINYAECQDIDLIPFSQTKSTGNPLADSMAKLSFKPKFVTALYNYYSGVPDDLIFETGDVIQIVEQIDGSWIKGNLNGKTGLVPLTYVEQNYE